MGSRTRVSVFTTLEASGAVTPGELEAFVAWVRAADRGERPEAVGFPVDGAVAGTEEAAAELLGDDTTRVHLAPAWRWRDPRTGADRIVWELGIQATEGGDPTGAYVLPLLVAPFASPGLVGTISREGHDDPTLVLAQAGVAFMAHRGGVPQAVTDGDAGPWRVEHERPSADDYRRFGIADAEGLARRAEEDGEPLLARHLLGRAVLRALRDLGDEVADPGRAEAARRGAQVALDVIAGGGDPRAVRYTPGWQLQEVDRFARTNDHGGRPSGRPIPRLGAVLADAGSSPLDAGAPPLAVGQVVELLVPFPPDVTAGARATVTEAYDMGHATARTEGRTGPTSVTIRTDDDGTTFRRV